MHDPFDLTTIIFALLAVFVAWKLRSVLGSRDGFEQNQDMPPVQPAPDASNIIRLPGKPAPAAPVAPDWSQFAEPGSPVAQGLQQVVAIDKRFEPASFLDGARSAHELILQSFASGDVKTLKMLLNDSLFANFSDAISARASRGEKLETTMIAQEKAGFEAVEVQNTTARITVRFRSKMITVTRDKAGTTIDGSPEQIADVQDVWTFSRDLTARDPNWKLVATLDA